MRKLVSVRTISDIQPIEGAGRSGLFSKVTKLHEMVNLTTAKLGDLFITRGNCNGFMLLELEAFDKEPEPIWVFKDKNSSALLRYEYTSDGKFSPSWWTRPSKLDIVAKVKRSDT